jgi:hypothetical protein
MKSADHDQSRRPATAATPVAAPSHGDNPRVIETKPTTHAKNDPDAIEEPGYGHGV